jgi:hypothetical protein
MVAEAQKTKTDYFLYFTTQTLFCYTNMSGPGDDAVIYNNTQRDQLSILLEFILNLSSKTQSKDGH